MKNIEIKARVDDIDEVEKRAKELSDTPLEVIKQHDIFFNLPSVQSASGGRLKLRQFQDNSGELIYYERPNVEGPKMCNYSKIDLDQQRKEELKELLIKSNGILGNVKKTRHLYMVGNTRIHIDRVFELGNFMELEVAISDTDDPVEGEKIAKNLMKDLGIPETSLLSGAYMDMIIKS
ncbi:hypothetical protein QAD02_015992 [Eretmocerus hayati]|uniref:Uncharacterized protein n=1 Tax=Eretmocerus hayati TaxID=131215 RepID=A0ACC2PEL4_9HYME|nr:hypothetical protein QAD02_015992 [Eretmocerus hayati]